MSRESLKQHVDWASTTPEMQQLTWRIVWDARKRSLWALVFLFLLVLSEGLYLHTWFMAWGFLFGVVFMAIITLLSYRQLRQFSNEVGKAEYLLDENKLGIHHQLAEVVIPVAQINRISSFPGGIHVHYGKKLMLTLPNGPVQQALSQRFKR